MLKGTQFYQTPSTGTIATVTSDMKWSSKLIDYLGNSLIDTHKALYSFGLSMCLLRQIYDTSHTSTQSHLTDLRPITRLSPSIAKMHQTVI